MILDMQTLFSDKQALTASAVSTNVIDLGPNLTDAGFGTKVPLLVQVVETFAGLTSLAIALQVSDDEAFTTPVTVFTQSLNAPALTLGSRIALNVLPYGTVKRYARLNYTVTGTGTAGKITAGITKGNDETLPFV